MNKHENLTNEIEEMFSSKIGVLTVGTIFAVGLITILLVEVIGIEELTLWVYGITN